MIMLVHPRFIASRIEMVSVIEVSKSDLSPQAKDIRLVRTFGHDVEYSSLLPPPSPVRPWLWCVTYRIIELFSLRILSTFSC
jgi:hypothetical protein